MEPYDSRAVLAATATIAVEILEDLEALGSAGSPVIYVPVSGGGLAGGVAAGAKLLDPRVRIVAVEPEVAADYVASRRAGERVAFTAEQMARTAADGLRVQQVGALPWPHLAAYVDDAVTVSEAEIRDAAARIWAETGLGGRAERCGERRRCARGLEDRGRRARASPCSPAPTPTTPPG